MCHAGMIPTILLEFEMKKVLLAILVLVAANSFATSIKINNIRLQSASTRIVDFHYSPANQHDATVISVDAYGDVTGARCTEKLNTELGVGKPVYTNCRDIKKVETLSGSEQRRVERLIGEAKYGEIIYPNPTGFHCLAMPNRADRYTADNGKVFLSAGVHPCGNVTYNDSPAAKTLVQELRAYETKYNKLVRNDLE